jgi:hypothetical protein
MFQPTAAMPRDVGVPAQPGTARDPVLVVTTWVAGIAAAVASFAALYGLARRTGWPDYTAWLYPLTIDAYAVAALRVWLGSRTLTLDARRRARRAAVGAIVASVAGNAALHAALAHVYTITWPVVVAVAATPPVVLGLVSHLFALRAMPAPAAATHGTDTPELPDAPPKLAELVDAPEPSAIPGPAELAGMSKAEAIRIALRQCDGNVIEAQAWLAARGVSTDRAYCHDVKAGRSGRRRQRRSPAPVLPEGVAAGVAA